MNSKIKEIREMFLVFDDPMDKYIQIIELGKKNTGIPYQEKNEFNKIFGCASLAWVIVEKKNSIYNISIDSDTFIVKGLLSILKYIIDGSTIKQIDTLDIKSLLYDRKFTIKGAKQHLKRPSDEDSKVIPIKKIIKLSNSLDIKTLKDLKQGLDDLIKLIEQFRD